MTADSSVLYSLASSFQVGANRLQCPHLAMDHTHLLLQDNSDKILIGMSHQAKGWDGRRGMDVERGRGGDCHLTICKFNTNMTAPKKHICLKNHTQSHAHTVTIHIKFLTYPFLPKTCMNKLKALTHRGTQTYTHKHTNTNTHIHMYVCTHAFTHTRTHTSMHTLYR